MYLPLSNDTMLCQWHYYIPSFKFKWNFENVNHFKLLRPPTLQLVISTWNVDSFPSYLTPSTITRVQNQSVQMTPSHRTWRISFLKWIFKIYGKSGSKWSSVIRYDQSVFPNERSKYMEKRAFGHFGQFFRIL